MATGSVVLGKLKGSIGDITTQSRGAKQVTRRRVREVSNPQTNAQTLNRIITATVGAAYARIKEICDHSFQGCTSKSENQQMFLKQNQNMLRTKLTTGNAGLNAGNFMAIGKSGLVPNPYIISKGSLPGISYQVTESSGEQVARIYGPVGTAGSITYADLCSWYNLKRGDQLTFVWICGAEWPSVAYDEELWGENNLFYYTRILLDPVDPTTGEKAPMTTNFFGADEKVNFPNPRNEGQDILVRTVGPTSWCIVPVNDPEWEERHLMAFAVIVSRYEGGSWQRSNARLSLSNHVMGIPTMQQAIDASYPQTDELLDPSKFLNASPKN